nr:hypothetical protein [Pseudoalteromonas rubra]
MAVVRDCDGCWTHPDLPMFDETTTTSEINAYLAQFGLTSHAVWMEYDCHPDEFERYFEAGDSNISFWNPACNIKGSFMLSIHDTDQGPIALFAYPLEARDA